MGDYRVLQPSLPLRQYVSRYVYIDKHVQSGVLRPISPRPEAMFGVNLIDREITWQYDNGRRITLPASIVCGPLTRRFAHGIPGGEFRVFYVEFQPAGFYRLFHVPLAEVVDGVHDATDVVGREAVTLLQQLLEKSTPEGMAQVMDDFLVGRLDAVDRCHAVRSVALLLRHCPERQRLAHALQSVGLGERQLERKFLEQIGMTPKRYARIARFRVAVRAKMEAPARSWTEVSHQVGYYDQMHLVKDFKDLVGATPSTFLRQIAPVPELDLS